MTEPKLRAEYSEANEESRISGVPLAHVSVELGHLYMEDFTAGPVRLRDHFRRIAPWATTALKAYADSLGVAPLRASTCFLIDDYFTRFSSPNVVVPLLIEEARSCGLEIDYVARESGCTFADDIPIAELVQARLVADPPSGSTGLRPPPTESGWLCNGQRSPVSPDAAMAGSRQWRPPRENLANRHSVFVDIELWDLDGHQLRWSCAFLSAVWQLLRLGMLRYEGAPVAQPRTWEGKFPRDWDDWPPIVRLNHAAAPFSAYHTFSVLANRFLHIESAVRTILNQVAIERAILEQTRDRSSREGMKLSLELVERVNYAFISWRSPG